MAQHLDEIGKPESVSENMNYKKKHPIKAQLTIAPPKRQTSGSTTMTICAWNVRGLNIDSKMLYVLNFLLSHTLSLSLIALYETKLLDSRI